jgi:hypothetical protein
MDEIVEVLGAGINKVIDQAEVKASGVVGPHFPGTHVFQLAYRIP